MTERDTHFDELVAGYLIDRDLRFGRALDEAGFAHNGPRSVELHVDDSLYCIPDGTTDPAGVARLRSAMQSAGVLPDVTVVVERVDQLGGQEQVWPEDRSYGAALMEELDPAKLPVSDLVLHLWLDLSVDAAEDDVRCRLDAGEDLYWMDGEAQSR